MHIECEQECVKHTELEVFPLADKLIEYQYVVKRGYEESDYDFLFTKYMGILVKNAFINRKWSILILLDDFTDYSDLSLVIQLGNHNIRMISMFQEINFS